jgi:hypothetical protein
MKMGFETAGEISNNKRQGSAENEGIIPECS